MLHFTLCVAADPIATISHTKAKTIIIDITFSFCRLAKQAAATEPRAEEVEMETHTTYQLLSACGAGSAAAKS